jgi:hypothetical protein
MKRSVLVVLALMLTASVAFAQNGSIAVFSDAGASDCNFADAGSLVQVYIWHVNTPGATASEWLLDVSQVGWTHLGDTADFNLVIGVSITGASLSYEACLSGSFKLMTVNFFGSVADPCALIGIVAAPNKPGVRAVDCAENSVIITGGQGRVNPDGTCQCTTPVEETTWGSIKAQYN